jgi:hypothetical protein
MCTESVLGKPSWKVHAPSKVGEGNEVIKLSRILRKQSCEVDAAGSGVCAVSVCCGVDPSSYMTTVTEMFAYRQLCLNVVVGCPRMDRSMNWLGAGLEGERQLECSWLPDNYQLYVNGTPIEAHCISLASTCSPWNVFDRLEWVLHFFFCRENLFLPPVIAIDPFPHHPSRQPLPRDIVW